MKVTLTGSEPPIWRRFQIREDATLGDLHYALQAIMPWDNSHLHEFRIRGTSSDILIPAETGMALFLSQASS